MRFPATARVITLSKPAFIERARALPRVLAILAASLAAGSHVRASEILPPKYYQVTTETGMPHLEENLRYATTREKRCLSHRELATAFPVLQHEALSGCRLDRESRQAGGVSYELLCEGGHGTSGTAVWRLGADQIEGTLNVKLGGKNMTFYQHITATLVGECLSRPN